MGALKIEDFGGMQPALDVRLIPQNFAEDTSDTWLLKGTLQGWKTPKLIHSAPAGTKKVFRIPNVSTGAPDFSGSTWMNFTDPNTDVLKTPLTNDSFDRYYWASPSAEPKYNPLARIKAGSTPYTLGIQAPGSRPSVVPAVAVPIDTTITAEVRVYVYTWISAYGEESAPSPPFTASGDPTSSWSITLDLPGTSDRAGRELSKTRLYRSVTGSDGNTQFYYVAEFPKEQGAYVDYAKDTDITSLGVLPSAGWSPPPADLQGLVAMPNGMMVGWTGKDLWFCEPYHPHAWPSSYTISVDYPIVGLGVFDQTLFVATTSFPYTATGTHPDSMSLSKIGAHEPCISRGSIVSTLDGVYYASQNGIVLANPGKVGVASEQVIRRTDWAALTDIYSLRAARYHQCYVAYPTGGSTSKGLIFSLQEQRMYLAKTTQNLAIVNFQEDLWTGELLLLTTDGSVYQLDPPDDVALLPYTWKSKEFQFTRPLNLEAMKVYFKIPAVGTPTLGTQTASPTVLADNMYGFVTVYVDGARKFSRELRASGEQWRLPSGFKGEVWQFEVSARVIVNSIQVAPTAKELNTV